VLGVVNFPTFYKAMDTAQHIVKLGGDGTLTAVELVDRTMIELSLQNPAFAPTVRTASSAGPTRCCWWSSPAPTRRNWCASCAELVELMGDLGLPGSVVRDDRRRAAEGLWEVRKAGLNIMMSLKGDGKPVSFIEDCAVPLEHLAEYTDALTQVFRKHGTKGTWYAHASVGTLHVRPILDMRRKARAKMRASPRKRRRWCASTRAPTAASTATACAAASGSSGSSGRRSTTPSREIKQLFDPLNLLCPHRMIEPAAHGRHAADALSAQLQGHPAAAALDWSAWDVQNDPATERTTAPGTGGDPAQGFCQGGGDVQQQRPLPQVRRRHHVPQLPRHARRKAPDARPRQHLAPGAVGPARPGRPGQRSGARGAGLVRGLQGLQARLPHRRRHGQDEGGVPAPLQGQNGWSLKDRLIAGLPDYAHWPAASRRC
jgi:hypothetical protein